MRVIFSLVVYFILYVNIIYIVLQLALDILEWNHDEVRFAMEGKLLYTNPTDNNWRKGRTIKLNPINALLVTNGKVCFSLIVKLFEIKLNCG
jgi:hypothetical protein